MSEQQNATSAPTPEQRRDFLKQAARAAVTAPAVALLLSASERPALARSNYRKPGRGRGGRGNGNNNQG